MTNTDRYRIFHLEGSPTLTADDVADIIYSFVGRTRQDGSSTLEVLKFQSKGHFTVLMRGREEADRLIQTTCLNKGGITLNIIPDRQRWRTVLVKGLDVLYTAADVVPVLRRYGEVLSVESVMFKSDVSTGIFKVKMCFENIPDVIYFGCKKCYITYDGMKIKCRHCGSGDHLIAQCPKRRCFKCRELGHFIRECPSNNLFDIPNEGENHDQNNLNMDNVVDDAIATDLISSENGVRRQVYDECERLNGHVENKKIYVTYSQSSVDSDISTVREVETRGMKKSRKSIKAKSQKNIKGKWSNILNKKKTNVFKKETNMSKKGGNVTNKRYNILFSNGNRGNSGILNTSTTTDCESQSDSEDEETRMITTHSEPRSITDVKERQVSSEVGIVPDEEVDGGVERKLTPISPKFQKECIKEKQIVLFSDTESATEYADSLVSESDVTL
jgi:hypothetical protein